ncbi:hypothetical protein AX16_010600 [Volvariella volvacea WC 439]|nr:hypothetical protein AX16_010600 [Volvariella volvacea WC 439]
MDETFQFIIESPQLAQGHKKRPRLVTSCDNCRLKKIKCLQPSPETKCEACRSAKIPCRFRDRERYFAERSRAIAGPNASAVYGDDHRNRTNGTLDGFSVSSNTPSPSLNSHSSQRSNSHSPKASGMVTAEIDTNPRYQYPQDTRRGVTSPSSVSPFYSRSNDPMNYSFVQTSPAHLQHHHTRHSSQPYNPRLVHLFDPDSPQRPHPSLMPHFIQLFFEQFSADFNFLTYDAIMGEYWENALSPLLANCIASLACRFSAHPELTVRGLHNVADAYADNAKTLLQPIAHIHNLTTLHALMLLSWAEYKNNRISGFKNYSQMATNMAMDLGLSDQSPIPISLSESEKHRRRSTWANILQLHVTASSCR